jgi:hypothetical protein
MTTSDPPSKDASPPPSAVGENAVDPQPHRANVIPMVVRMLYQRLAIISAYDYYAHPRTAIAETDRKELPTPVRARPFGPARGRPLPNRRLRRLREGEDSGRSLKDTISPGQPQGRSQPEVCLTDP